jgi:hypothetical protein
MEDKITSIKPHPSNFLCRTYWQYKENPEDMLIEPESKHSQYEIDVFDEGFGKKMRIKIFARSNMDPKHKRDYYTYLEFPMNSTFSNTLFEFLKEDREKDLTRD